MEPAYSIKNDKYVGMSHFQMSLTQIQFKAGHTYSSSGESAPLTIT